LFRHAKCKFGNAETTRAARTRSTSSAHRFLCFDDRSRVLIETAGGADLGGLLSPKGRPAARLGSVKRGFGKKFSPGEAEMDSQVQSVRRAVRLALFRAAARQK
jgi:hypothetical protein